MENAICIARRGTRYKIRRLVDANIIGIAFLGCGEGGFSGTWTRFFTWWDMNVAIWPPSHADGPIEPALQKEASVMKRARAEMSSTGNCSAITRRNIFGKMRAAFIVIGGARSSKSGG